MLLLYNDDTKRQLDAMHADPPHAMLFCGEKGVGLYSAAIEFANRQLVEIIRPTDPKGEIDEQSGSIRVDAIRALYEHTKGKSTQRQFFVIDDADKMNETAQNALLKLLEEPAQNVHFILTSHTPDALLATVLSRVERVTFKQVSRKQTATLLSEIDDSKVAAQITFLANGLPAELTRLMTDKKYFESRSALMRDAQTIIAGKPYERIQVVFAYASDRAKALGLLEAAKIIAKHIVTKTPTAETIVRADLLARAHDAVRTNGNVRLQLLRLAV